MTSGTTLGTFRIAGDGVRYDTCVSACFPPNTVVPLATVRQVMLDFALHGEWSHPTVWRAHEHMVA